MRIIMILENFKPLLASLYDGINPAFRPGISGVAEQLRMAFSEIKLSKSTNKFVTKGVKP